jgi:hypothetical protein
MAKISGSEIIEIGGTAFTLEVSHDIPVPPELLRKARVPCPLSLAVPAGWSPRRDAGLGAILGIAGRVEAAPQRWKLYRQGDRAIRLLLRQGRTHVAEVIKADLLTLVDDSYAEGLSGAAIAFRLACLATLGVKAKLSRAAIEKRRNLSTA